MKPSISYAITTHNEFSQLKKSIEIIERFKDKTDELLFLDDFSDNSKTLELLKNRNTFKKKFENDYAQHKNYLNSLCKCDYILQLDGDEYLNQKLIVNIKKLLQHDKIKNVDLFYIPRENFVQGIDKDKSYLKKMNWTIDNKKRLNYPDYQSRLYKNKKELYWYNTISTVHETIIKPKNIIYLPQNKGFDIIHKKHVDQTKQNNDFYEKLIQKFNKKDE